MQEMGVGEKAYREILELASRSYIMSLDEVIALEDGDVNLEDVLADDEEAGVVSAMEKQDEVRRITEALAKLSEQETQVISFYYYEELTLKEIGQILGVTESRVSQIHGKAIASLRALLAK
jgi:RNA polymerase sigma factor for flagellar operon FliA